VPVSVLVELVNLNNPADRRNLRDAAFRERIAAGFVEALLAFYDSPRPPRAQTASALGTGSR
jgi:N-acetylmuramoyl-L-alanine amidase